MEPIVCTRCGQSISNRFPAYRKMLADGHTPREALEALRVPTEADGLCCRSIYLTTVDLYEFRSGKYNREANISSEFKYEAEPATLARAATADSDDEIAVVKTKSLKPKAADVTKAKKSK